MNNSLIKKIAEDITAPTIESTPKTQNLGDENQINGFKQYYCGIGNVSYVHLDIYAKLEPNNVENANKVSKNLEEFTSVELKKVSKVLKDASLDIGNEKVEKNTIITKNGCCMFLLCTASIEVYNEGDWTEKVGKILKQYGY